MRLPHWDHREAGIAGPPAPDGEAGYTGRREVSRGRVNVGILKPLETQPMAHLLTVVLMLEFRLVAGLAGLFSSTWRWALAPLWLLLPLTVVTLAVLAALERLQQSHR